MKKKMNLTAIIAVAMVAMSVFVLGSCNADDGYNEFDYGTLMEPTTVPMSIKDSVITKTQEHEL